MGEFFAAVLAGLVVLMVERYLNAKDQDDEGADDEKGD
jgi:hypothetical protein